MHSTSIASRGEKPAQGSTVLASIKADLQGIFLELKAMRSDILESVKEVKDKVKGLEGRVEALEGNQHSE